jgi:hypothetical protein
LMAVTKNSAVPFSPDLFAGSIDINPSYMSAF